MDTKDSFSKIKSKSNLEVFNRQCWICLQTEFKDEINPVSGKRDLVDPNEKWLTPCNCKGSTQYVHEECLINWIKMKREMDQKNKLCCPSCQTPYTILIPKKTLLQNFCIYVVNKTESILKIIPIIIKYICIAFCIWEFSYFYGKFTLNAIFENEFPDSVFKENEYIKTFLYRTFPITLISMLFIPWEFSFLISATIIQFATNKEVMITMILLYAVSCDFFSSSIRLVLDYIYELKINLGLKNDEKTREQRRLLRLSKSVTFPNARVHINENFISPSSFTLKIHILEDTQNPLQANPQVLYVEYEKAIILLAVIKSKILHFLISKTNRNGNNAQRQPPEVNNINHNNVNNNVNNNNNNNNMNNNNNINNVNQNPNNLGNNAGVNELNDNHINININNLNSNLSISTVNMNMNLNNNINNNIHGVNDFNRRFSNVNNTNSSTATKYVRQHKKCQSLPAYLTNDSYREKAFSCMDLNINTTHNFNKLMENKSVSIGNMFDNNNCNSFQCLLNTPIRTKKYNEMIDSNIDSKLKSSLKNIILSNKENNFMKILNKQKSLYNKLTTSNLSLDGNSKKKAGTENSTKDKKMKNKEVNFSNDKLHNKPSSSNLNVNVNDNANISDVESSSQLPSPSKTNKKSNLSNVSFLDQDYSSQKSDNSVKNKTLNNDNNTNLGNNNDDNINNNNNNNNNNNINNNENINNVNNNVNNNNNQNNVQNNAQNNAQNNVNNRRTKEAYLTINITNVNNHVKNLIIKTLSLPIIALIIGRLVHWFVLIVQLLLRNLHLYTSVEYNEIMNNFNSNPLIYTSIGIIIASTFSDVCHLYYHYSKNIEKQKLIVLNHQDISKKLYNYTSIN